MINIRQDLIEKELESNDFIYHKFNLHNSLISKLYNHYKLVEFCENYYDRPYDRPKGYKSQKIEFCNWQEPYFKGNWGMSQKYVDNLGRDTLKKIKRLSISNKDRLYIGYKDNQIRIYFYGRDFMEMDYWFIYERR